MNSINQQAKDYLSSHFDLGQFATVAVIILAAMLVLGLISRLCFGKRGTLSIAVMSAITILGVYILTIVLTVTSSKLSFLLSPLPFVRIQGERLIVFQLIGADFGAICSEVLDLMTLAFLVNLLERWMPKGKKLVAWYLFRFLSVVLAICLNYVLGIALSAVLPAAVANVSSTVVIIVILSALLLGLLKTVIGGVLVFLNPLLALLYAFFFSNFIGKMVTRALLTSAIFTAGVWALNLAGIATISIATAALIGYIPFLLIVLVLWYVIGKIF